MEWWVDIKKDDILFNFEFMYDRYKQKRNGYIYFIRCGEYHKIGRAKLLSKRISAYSTHSPYDFKVIKTLKVEDYIYFEKLLHMIFSNFRHRGEWYKFPPNLLEIINEILKKYGK